MKSLLKLILTFILLLNIAHGKTKDKVSIQLKWLDQFQFAGYYIAKEKGFYDELNLDVEIKKYKKRSGSIVDKVLKEEATFATGKTSLLIHKNQGKDVVVLAAIFQHSPDVLLVTNPNIKNVADLKNKNVMISTDAVSSASYMSMFSSEGLKKDEIIKQKHSYNVNDLIEGKTDAIASYISNEPYRLEKKGISYKYFNPKDYGFDFYGDLLYTSKSFFDKNPTIVKNFTYASLKGWNYAFDNIKETANLIFEKYNAQNKTLDELIYEGETLKKLAYDKDNTIGHLDKQRFEDIAKIYRVLNLIKKDYTLDGFLYHAHCLDNDLNLSIEEIMWLNKQKELRLAVDDSWKPIEFIDNDAYRGISAGYKELLEKKLNIKFTFQKDMPWSKSFQMLKNKELDLGLALVKTKQREEFLNFTSPYIKFPAVIVTKHDVGYIKNLNQLSFKSLVLEKSYYKKELIKQINPNIKIIEVESTKDALRKVYEGSAFAYIGTLPIIGILVKELKYTNLKINGEAPFKTEVSIASRKDLPLLNSILEKTLASISEEEHNKIYDKWINIEYKHSVDYSIIIFIVLFGVIALLVLYIRNRELQELSETDNLTKIANRRKINQFLELEIEKAKRTNSDLSLIMLDIDYFKKVNDSYGHKEGDKVLSKLAKTLKRNIRKYELVGRWGGEEFVIVCPASNLSQAIEVCKKMQGVIKAIKYKKTNNITVSFGVAQFKEEDDLYSLVQNADRELYKAKESGRDCIFPKLD